MDTTQPHTQQTVMLCVFQHLFITTTINFFFFSNLCHSSFFVGSEHTG